ncbi:hypothetical protein Tco_1323279, partial [Tanacetum coccineum]
HLTNQAMLESEAYMTPKPKTTKKKANSEASPKTNTTQATKGKKNQQLKLVIERSKTQTHSSHASGSSAYEGTGVKPGVPDVPSYNSNDEQISWKSSDEEDDDEVRLNDDDDNVDNQDDENQDDDNEQMDSDNDGDDFIHPKFSTHDDDAKQDEEVNEEGSFDPRVQTPSHVESTDDESNEESDEEV